MNMEDGSAVTECCYIVNELYLFLLIVMFVLRVDIELSAMADLTGRSTCSLVRCVQVLQNGRGEVQRWRTVMKLSALLSVAHYTNIVPVRCCIGLTGKH